MPHPVDNRQKQTWRPPQPTRVPRAPARSDRSHDVDPDHKDDKERSGTEPAGKDKPAVRLPLRIPSRRK